MCLDTNVSGHKRVWAQMCLGTNVYGHTSVFKEERKYEITLVITPECKTGSRQ